MKRWLAWASGIALLIGAWVIVQVTPEDGAAEAPFPVTAAVGERAEARDFVVTVSDPRIGEGAAADGWSAEGDWLVVDLEIEARYEESGAALRHAALVVNGLTYRASERPASLLGSEIAVGIPRTGSIAFELPPELVRAEARLELALSGDVRLDSVVEVTLDLASVTPQPEVELRPSEWGAP